MKAYHVTIGNQAPFTMLADDERALFDRLMFMADADDVRPLHVGKYNHTLTVQPLGEVV